MVSSFDFSPLIPSHIVHYSFFITFTKEKNLPLFFFSHSHLVIIKATKGILSFIILLPRNSERHFKELPWQEAATAMTVTCTKKRLLWSCWSFIPADSLIEMDPSVFEWLGQTYVREHVALLGASETYVLNVKIKLSKTNKALYCVNLDLTCLSGCCSLCGAWLVLNSNCCAMHYSWPSYTAPKNVSKMSPFAGQVNKRPS